MSEHETRPRAAKMETLVCGALMLTAGLLLSCPAHAVELFPDGPGPAIVVVEDPMPEPVVIVRARPPSPPVVVRPRVVFEDRVLVREHVEERRVVRQRRIVRDAGPGLAAADDEGAPRLVLGAGVGPMFVLSSAQDDVVVLGHGHVGVGLGDVELGVRVGFAPYAASLLNDAGEARDTGLYTTDVTFTYRFLPEADVHPILGAGLGAVIATPEGLSPAAGFGVSLRAGLELGVDTGDGELGVGLDALGTQVVGAEEGFPWQLATSLTIGAHLDYRM